MNTAQKTGFRRLSPISDKIGSTDSAVAGDPETFPPNHFLDFRVDHQSKIWIELSIRIRLLVLLVLLVLLLLFNKDSIVVVVVRLLLLLFDCCCWIRLLFVDKRPKFSLREISLDISNLIADQRSGTYWIELSIRI